MIGLPRFGLRSLLIFVTLACSLTCMFLIFQSALHSVIHGRESIEFQAKFCVVDTGMREVEVIKLLGPPDEKSPDFYLAQESGFESTYKRAEESSSTHFLIYREGIDLVYVVGIDENGEVTLKEVGGT